MAEGAVGAGGYDGPAGRGGAFRPSDLIQSDKVLDCNVRFHVDTQRSLRHAATLLAAVAHPCDEW